MQLKIRHYCLLGILVSIMGGCEKVEEGEGLSAGKKMATQDAVIIEDLFVKQMPPGQNVTAGYMRIKNVGKVSQTLNYIHSPIAEHVEIHRSIYKDGMMQMRPVKGLSVNPGEQKILEPGGFHLMIMGIYDNLEVGGTFPMTFEFTTGAVITADVQVKPHG